MSDRSVDPAGPPLGQRAAVLASADPGLSGDPETPDAALVRRLRAGDADAFEELVEAWTPLMLRVARSYLSTHASAEEVVQDAWLAVLKGLANFEGRSSLKTWTMRILTNIAKTRSQREGRSVPMSTLLGEQGEDLGPTVDPARFGGPGSDRPRAWLPGAAPVAWATPEGDALAAEVRRLVDEALTQLPPRQRQVVELRDVQGVSADEVCVALELTPGNQRILLHRGRAKVRAALEDYYRQGAR